MKTKAEKFNLRVYGIWIKEMHILLCNEQINDFRFTKFPGGGVIPGEGIMDALKREFLEETGIQIHQTHHFYTTDFYQQSAFNPKEQLISVYYKVSCSENPLFYEKDESTQDENKHLKSNWYPLSGFNSDLLTFPVDKIVADMILEKI